MCKQRNAHETRISRYTTGEINERKYRVVLQRKDGGALMNLIIVCFTDTRVVAGNSKRHFRMMLEYR